MITCYESGTFLVNGVPSNTAPVSSQEAKQETMAYRILQAHSQSPDPNKLQIKFDAMVSHDITYVGIIQQARASGMKEFPHSLRPDQLPQQPMRCGRHHQ